MAKKTKTFAEKALGKKDESRICPKCEQAYEHILVVGFDKSEETENWKTNKSMVQVCKCNEKEVYA